MILGTEYWMILNTCHRIKAQDEKGHKNHLCCEEADGEGEDQTDVVVRQDDHLNWAIDIQGQRKIH